MHFREAKLPIHLKRERATGEGLSELPTESKMLESTRALKMNTVPEQHTTSPMPKKGRKAETAVRQEAQYKHHSQDWRQSLEREFKE